MFPSFELFGRQFGMYGILTVLGGIACVLVGARLIKRSGIKMDDLILVMIAAAAGVVVISHLVYGITNLRIIIATFRHLTELSLEKIWNLLAYSFGGMVFYGGFIGGALGILIYCKCNKKLAARDFLDIYAVLVPLFHTFGRIGCFLGGCCYGIESSFGFTVHGNTINPSVNDVNRLPVQLFEAGCNLIIFLVMLYFFRKSVMRDKLIYVYMLIYPPVRFVLEFFRGDTYRGFLLGLSTSQWISILLFAFSVIMLTAGKLKRKKSINAAA